MPDGNQEASVGMQDTLWFPWRWNNTALQWHSTLETLWSVWSESFSGATEKINSCFKSKNYSYQANSGKNSSKFSFLHPSSELQWWHPQREKMTPPSRLHYTKYYAYDGHKIRYQESKNPKKQLDKNKTYKTERESWLLCVLMFFQPLN